MLLLIISSVAGSSAIGVGIVEFFGYGRWDSMAWALSRRLSSLKAIYQMADCSSGAAGATYFTGTAEKFDRLPILRASTAMSPVRE